MTERLAYRFGPLERRGLLGPLRAGQALVLASGAVIGVGVLDAAPTGEGAFVATVLFAAGAALAVAPVGGRTLEEWAPVVAVFILRGLRGRRTFRSPLPTIGLRSRSLGRRGMRPRLPAAEPPPSLRGLRILGGHHRGRPIGVIWSQGGRYLSAVLACRATAFGLLDPDAQERRLGRWGQVLSGAGKAPIRRLQWLERTAPAQGDELARWVHTERDPSIPLRGTAMIDSYLELIDTTARVSHEHEILLALQVDTRRMRQRGADAATAALLEQVERVAQGLEAAEVTVLGALGETQRAPSCRRSRRRTAGATAFPRPAPGRWPPTRRGTTTPPTAQATPHTG